MEGLQKMGDKQKMFYRDEEGSLYSNTAIEYLEDEELKNIEHGTSSFRRRIYNKLQGYATSVSKINSG